MTDRRRSIAVGVGAAALGLAAIVGFSSGGSDQRGVCVDKSTDVRVDDDVCEDESTGGGHGWYYIPAGRRAPALGQAVSGQGSFSAPRSDSFSKGGVAADGGEVTRGGFRSGNGSFGG